MTEKFEDNFFDTVRRVMKNAVEEHGEFHSIHEGWAVTREELEELWDQVRLKKKNRDPFRIRHECIDICVAAAKVALTFGAGIPGSSRSISYHPTDPKATHRDTGDPLPIGERVVRRFFRSGQGRASVIRDDMELKEAVMAMEVDLHERIVQAVHEEMKDLLPERG